MSGTHNHLTDRKREREKEGGGGDREQRPLSNHNQYPSKTEN